VRGSQRAGAAAEDTSCTAAATAGAGLAFDFAGCLGEGVDVAFAASP